VDLSTDPENCGACDASCESGWVCEAARCVEPCAPGPRFLWPNYRSFGFAAPWSALADLNADGRADVVAPGEDGGVFVYAGSLGAVFADPVPASPDLVGLASLDGVAMPTTGITGPRVAVLLEDGITVVIVGAEGASTNLSLGASATDLLTGDVNGDGVIDLVAVHDLEGTQVTVLQGAVDGTFAVRPPAEVPGIWSLLADLDGDGAADLVGGPSALIALADGQGGFAAPRTLPSPVDLATGRLAALDADGDRRAELAVAWGDYDDVAGFYRTFLTVLRFAGDRFDAVETRERDSEGEPVAGDLDGDGQPELIASGSSVDVYRVSPDGSLRPDGRYVPPDGLAGPVIGDVNGDGLPDVVGLGSRGGATVIRGRSGGRLGAVERLPAGRVVGADVTDVDGDGRPDVVAATGRDLVVFPGDGRGRYGPPRVTALPSTALALDRLGPESEGGRSLAVLLDDWSVATLAPSPEGSYSIVRLEPLPGGQARESGSIAVADFDGDGLRDVAVVSYELWKLWLLEGQSDGTIALARVLTQEEASTQLNGPIRTPLSPVDVDRDDRIDLVYSYGNCYVELMNQGEFLFRRTRWDIVPSQVRILAPFDADGDGRPELAATYAGPGMDVPEETYGVAILAGQNGGSLSEVARLEARAAFDAYALSGADFDGDGDNDLFIADPSEGAMAFENLGGLRFAPGLDFDTESIGGLGRIGVGDLDGDGRLDVALADGTGVELFYGGCR
jgi:hypothetical protein